MSVLAAQSSKGKGEIQTPANRKDSSLHCWGSSKYLTNFWFNNPFERLQQWIPLSYFLIIYKRESRVKNTREPPKLGREFVEQTPSPFSSEVEHKRDEGE